MTSDSPHLRVSEIGEFIRNKSCERRLRLEVNGRQEARGLPFADRLFNALDPVLAESGRLQEDELADHLRSAGYLELTQQLPSLDDHEGSPSWEEFATALGDIEPGRKAFGREVRVNSQLGAFQVSGRIDFVLLTWTDEAPVLRLIEAKASRRDRTYHRIQVCIYQLCVQNLLHSSPISLDNTPIDPATIEAVVARIDEATNRPQDVLALEALNLETERADLERLLATGGQIERIAVSDLEQLRYQIEPKCDACVFSVHCLPESARRRSVELIGVAPSTVRALNENGLVDLDGLAALDLESDVARTIRNDSRFSADLATMQTQARVRLQTLPRGEPQISPPSAG